MLDFSVEPCDGANDLRRGAEGEKGREEVRGLQK
jgi:hypothetical protein